MTSKGSAKYGKGLFGKLSSKGSWHWCADHCIGAKYLSKLEGGVVKHKFFALSESALKVGTGFAIPAMQYGCIPMAEVFESAVSSFKVHDWNLFGAGA